MTRWIPAAPHGATNRAWRMAFAAALLLGAAVPLAMTRIPRARTAAHVEVLVPRADELDEYVGPARCAECHASIHERQSHSRMARALMSADEFHRRYPLPLPADIADPENHLRYRVDVRHGKLYLEAAREDADEVAVARLQYALGSGDRGLTFLGEIDADFYRELRVSYYADGKHWDLTPGQEADRPTSAEEALGRRVEKHRETACLNCHSSRLIQSDGTIDQAASHFGVDCERCHGAGRRHAEAAVQGRLAPIRPSSLVQALSLADQLHAGQAPRSPQDQFLQFVAAADDERLLRDLYVCGQCHGTRQIWSPPDEEHLARFQVAALVASKCYQASAKKLRCTDCHDPHRDIDARDSAIAVAVCLECHSGSPRGPDEQQPGRSPETVRLPPCPVNETSRCIECHMPTRSPMYRTRFTHHRIGVYPESVVAGSAPTTTAP